MQSNIGIFGGTFNPIHNAHLNIAESFVREINLDLCYFVPAYQSPFRINESDIISPEYRLEMVEIALKKKSKFSVLKYEIEKKETSYTIDTVKHIRELHSNDNLFLLIGGDQAKSFYLWNKYKEILSLVELCIIKRPNFSIDEITQQKLTSDNKQARIIQTELYDISASQIRENIKNGNNVSSVIPEEVYNFIKLHKLYL